MTRRNLGIMVVLTIITFGIYYLYWYCSVQNQLRMKTGRGFGGLGHLLMLFIPFVNFVYMIYWMCVVSPRIAEAGGANRGALPVLCILIPFVGSLIFMLWMQNDVNNIPAGQPQQQMA